MPVTKLFPTTRIANRPGHGKIVVKVLPSAAAMPKSVRHQSVLSVLSAKGVSPNFGWNLQNPSRKSFETQRFRFKRGSAKWLAEHPSWRK
jgi:hypothetical protein